MDILLGEAMLHI